MDVNINPAAINTIARPNPRSARDGLLVSRFIVVFLIEEEKCRP
jgi:hypothetical protein